MLTSPALRVLSLEPVLMLPVSTFPVRLVTLILPPAAVVELASRAAVLMSPLASSPIDPRIELLGVLRRFPLAAMLLAA